MAFEIESIDPSDNPFLGLGKMKEIWAYGLRNVWRFSFDRANDDISAWRINKMNTVLFNEI